MKIWMLLLTLMALMGCATQPPTSAEMNSIPVVKFGDPIPDKENYVLHFPAGQAIPTNISVQGNIFSKNKYQRLDMALIKDIYSYKNWISFDGKNWLDGQKILETRIVIKIPGYGHPEPGIIEIKMNEKKK